MFPNFSFFRLSRALFTAAIAFGCFSPLTFAQDQLLKAQPPGLPDSPAPLPAFRNVLTDNDFQLRSRIVASKIRSLLQVKASTQPHVGQCVETWSLQKLNILAGDIITSTNAGPIKGVAFELADLPELRQVTLYRPRNDKTITVDLSPDEMPEVFPFIDLTLCYIHSPDINPAWDANVVLALEAAVIDPDLAETALARAIAQGYKPGPLAIAAGARIASAQARQAQTLACLAALPPTHPQFGDILIPSERATLAMAVGAFQTALDLARQAPEKSHWAPHIVGLLDKDHTTNLQKLPSQRMDEFRRVDAARTAGQFQHGAQGPWAIRNFTLDAPDGRKQDIDMQPPGGFVNAEIRLRVRLTSNPLPTANNPETAGRQFRISFFDMKKNPDGDYNLVGFLSLADHNGLSTLGWGSSSLADDMAWTLARPTNIAQANGTDVHEIRFIYMEGLFQALIDDKTAACFPHVYKNILLGCMIQVIGMRAQILKLDVIELIPNTPANSAQAPISLPHPQAIPS